jgi:cytoskeletal protein CcmA (bactofilin family)
MARMNESVIDQRAVIVGKVHGEGDLEIAGRVEGEVTITGDLRVSSTGMIGGNITAHSIVVEGAIRGNLSASEQITLLGGTRIVGDVRAPRIAIEDGALVRGFVQTANTKGAFSADRARPARREEQRREEQRREPVRAERPLERAPVERKVEPVRASEAREPAKASQAKVAAAPPPRPVPITTMPKVSQKVVAAEPKSESKTGRAERRPIPSIKDLVGKAARVAPPAPVIPALKKGAKAQKRKG